MIAHQENCHMSVVINCPACQKKLRLPENLVGKTVKCPSCQEKFTATEKIDVADAPAPPPPPPAPPEIFEQREVEKERFPEPPRRRLRDWDDEDDDFVDDAFDDEEAYERPRRRNRRSGRAAAKSAVAGPAIALMII